MNHVPLRSAIFVASAMLLVAAAPRSDRTPDRGATFPASNVLTLSNGAIVVSQTAADLPLVSVNAFFPAGASQQPASRAGVAAVTAAVVLASHVEGEATLDDVAANLGASLTYTIDPQDTRFSIECSPSDLPRLMTDLARAVKSPDASALPSVRTAAIQAARDAIRDPAMTAFAMIREAQFNGSAYARLDQGAPTTLAALSATDIAAFAAQYRHGAGTVVALSGDATSADVDAAKAAVADFASSAAPAAAVPVTSNRTRQVVAHRDVASPWVAVGYAVPSQFSADFPAMLVVEALLGRGGDVHAFSAGSEAPLPEDFIGGYYQYEAQPGLLIEFFNGSDVDRELHALDDGIVRLRASELPTSLLSQAKSLALGDFLTSVTTLDDQSWLLGRSALSPAGVGFENALPSRIQAVTAVDVRRVAQRYLSTQTIAVVLPNSTGQ